MSSRFLCGTPSDFCCGAFTMFDAALGRCGRSKAHPTRVDAFKCYQKYLLSKGYKKVGTREFLPPDGGPVLLLNRKGKFGGMLRNGKSGVKSLSGRNRFMPKHLCKHSLGGMIIEA